MPKSIQIYLLRLFLTQGEAQSFLSLLFKTFSILLNAIKVRCDLQIEEGESSTLEESSSGYMN